MCRMVAVLKCRVSINWEKRGRGWDGCRSAPLNNGGNDGGVCRW